MTMADIEEKLSRYQKFLDNHKLDEDVESNPDMLRVIRKLSALPVSLKHLQVTGIGKTVNTYRKRPGQVGIKVKELIGKWKSLLHVENASPSVSDKQKNVETKWSSSSISQKVSTMPCTDSYDADSIKNNGSSVSSGKDIDVYEEQDDEKSVPDISEKCVDVAVDETDFKDTTVDRHVTFEKIPASGHIEQAASVGESLSFDDLSQFDSLLVSKFLKRKGKGSCKQATSISLKSSSREDHPKSTSSKKHSSASDKLSSSQKYSSGSDKLSSSSKKHSSGSSDKLSSSSKKHSSGSDKLSSSSRKHSSGSDKHSSSSKHSSASDKHSSSSKHSSGSDKHSSSSKHSSGSYKAAGSSGSKADNSASSSKHSEYSKKSSKTKESSKSVGATSYSSGSLDSSESKISSSVQTNAQEGKKRKSVSSHSSQPSKQIKMTELDISSDLPSISPNYHPLPFLKPEEKIQKPTHSMDDALSGLKRHGKTQVYSGRKQKLPSGVQSVPSLFDSCMFVLKENIDCLEHVGGVPCDILMPVLDKCSSTQLFILEEYNPQFVGETESLWEKHCIKDFKSAVPGEFECWRELYLREHDAREERLKKLTANITHTIAKSTPVRKTLLAYVDSSAKAPRSVRRAQIKHGTAGPSHPKDPNSRIASSRNRDSSSAPRVHVQPSICEPSVHRKRSKRGPMMTKSLRMLKAVRR